MAVRVDTRQVRELLDEGAQLVEVLPQEDYQREHLPGAINLPLTSLTQDAVGRLDRHRPVIVYCFDTQCDLSARGAAMLECFGFEEVYDYTASKAAWLAMDEDAEGDVPAGIRAGALARPAVTCRFDTALADLHAAGPGGVVVVVDDDNVVVGAVREPALGGPGRAIDVAEPGPVTVRPSVTADELAQSMDRRGETYVLVSTLDGRVVGVVERRDLDVDR